MSQTNFAPPKHTRTDVQIGLVFEDQRTGDLRRVVYADSRVVLVRDESNSTTLVDRDAFEAELGTRYRARPNADADIDAGQYDSLRDALAEYDGEDGRKASHKADALREALDLFPGHGTGDADDSTGTGATDEDADDESSAEDADGDATADDAGSTDDPEETEVPLEEIPGIGPDTAGKLRVQGFVTESDLRGASDDAILAVSGVGPSNLENIREYLDADTDQ